MISYQKIKLATRVLRRVFRRHKKPLILIILLGFLAGLSGGIGIGAIIPLFSVLTGESVGVADFITQTIEKVFIFLHIPFTLPFLGVLIAFLFVLKAAINFLARYVDGRTTAEYEAVLRSDLFSKTLRASWPYLLNQKTGHIERMIMHDVFAGTQILAAMTNLILLGTSLAMYAFIAFNISAGVTLLTILFGLILFWIFKPLYYKTRKLFEQSTKIEKITAGFLTESLYNSKAIKAFGVEKEVVFASKRYFKKLKRLKTKATIYRSSVGPFFEPIALMFIIGLFIFYQRTPGFNFVSFAATVYLVQKMFSFIELSQGNIQRLSEIIPYFQSVLDYRTETFKNLEVSNGHLPFSFKDNLAFEKVNFSYETRSGVISGLSFVVKRGEMVGIVGSSGAGKTTVADLLLRLFRPSSGKITIDGKNTEELRIADWRKKIGYVSQDVFLLNDTIENNIRFFDSGVTEKDIKKAAELANADDFIEKLPDGLSTVIGERGVKLSVGQRQRIALARVLARNPEILLLDEATSALDNESELLVQKAIEDLKGKITVIAIAHRLSTVMNSDRLLVLDNGKIVEEGAPKELLKDKDSHFYKIYNIKEQ
jgi:ABC-type multidrug transport system fused ATPase/permease subunit